MKFTTIWRFKGGDFKTPHMPEHTCQTWAEPSRAAALSTLERALPQFRNGELWPKLDLGPELPGDEALLHLYLARGLLSPGEVAAAALGTHKPAQLERLIEYLGRGTYNKGWLEARPLLWATWKRAVIDERRSWEGNPNYQAALAATTGIPPFDGWMRELLEFGRLHPQARQAFASIWLFTLKLPWSLGADLFFRHLLAGSPSSILLNWRSVAGLQSGKHLLVKAPRIQSWTKGRFVGDYELAAGARAIRGPQPAPPAKLTPYPQAPSELLGESYGLLITGDELAPDHGPLRELKPKIVVSLSASEAYQSWNLAPGVQDFQKGALVSAKVRLEAHFDCPTEELLLAGDAPTQLASFMATHGVENLVYYEPSVGPWKDHISTLHSRDVGVRFFPLRRSWEAKLMPLADRGFVQFQKQANPRILRSKGLL